MCNIAKKRNLGMAMLGTLLCWQTASAGQEWQWGITPYLWGSSIELDATVNDAAVGGKVEFNDLIDKLDAALQVHIEGHSSGPWGVFGDFTYISNIEFAHFGFLRKIFNDLKCMLCSSTVAACN